MKKNLRPDTRLPMVLPENFDADVILKPLCLRKDEYANLKGSMYYILNTLYTMSLSREEREKFEEKGGYPVSAEILLERLGPIYKKAISLLCDNGVIERLDSYVVGEQSKLMRLTNDFASASVKTRDIPKDSSIRKRLLTWKNKEIKKNENALNKVDHVTKWFNPQRLTLDIEKAHALIEFYRAEMIVRIPESLPSHLTREKVTAYINYRVNNMIETVRRFKSGDMNLTKTGDDTRLHSTVSSTKKVLRSLYKYDGKEMELIDVKASQPYLLTQLTKPEFWKEEALELLPDLKQVFTTRKMNQILSILMFKLSPQSEDCQGFQGIGFAGFPWMDDFYTYLVNMAKAEDSSDIFPDRESGKKLMMQILYDSGEYVEGSAGYKLFAKWFPKEASVISFFRKLTNERKRRLDTIVNPIKRKVKRAKKEIVNYLPVLLQRLESRFILEKVCLVISQKIPEAPLITVHDCIMTTSDYSDSVREIMEAELTQLTGIPPGLTTERFDEGKTFYELGQMAEKEMKDLLKRRRRKKMPKFDIPFIGTKPPLLFSLPSYGRRTLISGRFATLEEQLLHGSLTEEQEERMLWLIDDL